MSSIYTATATSSGDGRNGHVRSPDGFVDLDVRMPPALGGAGGATNPEQLFAAAYAACFHSALRMAARAARTTVPDDATVEVAVGIGPDGDGFAVNATIEAVLPGLAQAEADELVAAAHRVCPYSRATRGNIEVQLSASVTPTAAPVS